MGHEYPQNIRPIKNVLSSKIPRITTIGITLTIGILPPNTVSICNIGKIAFGIAPNRIPPKPIESINITIEIDFFFILFRTNTKEKHIIEIQIINIGIAVAMLKLFPCIIKFLTSKLWCS